MEFYGKTCSNNITTLKIYFLQCMNNELEKWLMNGYEWWIGKLYIVGGGSSFMFVISSQD